MKICGLGLSGLGLGPVNLHVRKIMCRVHEGTGRGVIVFCFRVPMNMPAHTEDSKGNISDDGRRR